MKLRELRRLAAGGESEQLEFKKSTSDLKGAMETLCGFLNGKGGKVLFGVSATGKITGQMVSDATLREVAAEINRLDPPATIALGRVAVSQSHEVLVLETTAYDQAPYTYGGRAFQRVASTTSLLPQTTYQRQLLERGHVQQRWENQIAAGYRVAHLDRREIERTVKEALNANRLESTVESPQEVLERLNLITDQDVLQAGVVAFAKRVLPGYPQCGLRMARFRGIRKDEFLDQRQIHGHAFLLLDEALLFLRRHLPVAGRFESGVMTRLDEPLFPTLALREALVNAICHRDYSLAGGAISLAIFDDRLEIASTGTLPFGLTVQDLKEDHASRPRNPLLAEIFYRRGLIERWGRGTQKIVSLCVDAGHPAPEFEERSGEVVVRFIPSAYIPPYQVTHDLTERQRRILHALCDGTPRKAQEIRAQFHSPLPRSTLSKELGFLRTLGLLESSGYGAGAQWRLKSVEKRHVRRKRSSLEKPS
jgi:ATP-dependent DNA helicase RecG